MFSQGTSSQHETSPASLLLVFLLAECAVWKSIGTTKKDSCIFKLNYILNTS